MHGTLPISERQALELLRGETAGRKSIAVLAREWGWSRDKVRRRLESWRSSGDLSVEQTQPKRRTAQAKVVAIAEPALVAPIAALPLDPIPPAEPAAPPVEDVLAAPQPAPAELVVVPVAPPAPSRLGAYGRGLATAMVATVGIALAVIGMIETTAYALRVGGWLFAALAICADAMVLVMPAAVAALWRRRSPAVIVAAALWLVGGAVTLANLSGYIGSSDDAFRAGRESQSTQRTLAMEQLSRLRHERAAIAELRPVGALNAALKNARQSRRPALREALAVAERRDAVESELTAISASLPAVPQLAIIDPSANVLAEISGLSVSELFLRRLRLALLLMLPLCGGFVVSIAFSLSAPLPRLEPAP
jgi:hypothetical protein